MPPVWQFLSCILFWLFVVTLPRRPPFFLQCWVFIAAHRHYPVVVSRGYSLVMLCRLLIVVASLVPKHLLLVLIWGYCFLLSFLRPWLTYHTCKFTFGPDGAVGILLTPHCHFYIIILPSFLKYPTVISHSFKVDAVKICCLLPSWFWSFLPLG